MKLLSNKDTLFDLIQQVKQAGKTFLTNFFIDQDKINNWLANNQLYYTDSNDGLLLFRKNYHFYHLYYSVNSLENLASLLPGSLPKEIIVIDLIGKSADIEPVSTVLGKAGFTTHTTLERLTRINKEGVDNYQPINEVEVATEAQSERITQMMHDSFDKYSEQVHTLEDTTNLARQGKIIVIRDNDIIKGFLVRNILPQSSVLNNFLVDPQFRNEKIGSKLLKHYIFESRNTKRLWLWVLKDNAHAIGMYEKHGYAKDGLTDLVMILNNTNEQNN